MGEFTELTLSRVPPGLEVPEPVRLPLEWVEAQGFVERGKDGDLYGSLNGRWPTGPGTNVLLRGDRPDEADRVAAWLGSTLPDTTTIWQFCRTGGDGSMAALWRAPDGRVLVVHLGSGSGSILTCVLGETAVDFLRLLAIGYDEICWNEDWDSPPRPEPDDHVVLNEPYRRWAEETFATTIPATAAEIVPNPSEEGDRDTEDVWCRWVNAHLPPPRTDGGAGVDGE